MATKLYKCVLACLLALYSASILTCSKTDKERLNRHLDIIIGEWVKVAPYREIIHNHLTQSGRLYGVVYTQEEFIGAIEEENGTAKQKGEVHFFLGPLIDEVLFFNSYYLGLNLNYGDSLFVPDIDDDGRIRGIPAKYGWDKETGITPINILGSNSD